MLNLPLLVQISVLNSHFDVSSSVGHVGEWQHPQPGGGQAHGIQEPFLQHGYWCRWSHHLHPRRPDPPGGTVSRHHARPRFGSWDCGSGGAAALPLHQCRHSQQPAVAQRCVLMEQWHAAKARALKAPESLCTSLANHSSKDSICICV